MKCQVTTHNLTIDLEIEQKSNEFSDLLALGYTVNNLWQIVSIKDNSTKPTRDDFKSKDEYDSCANVVTQCVWNVLISKLGMQGKESPFQSLAVAEKQHLNTSPKKRNKTIASPPRPQVFFSKDWNLKQTLLLLIPGANVRAGMWSRSICVYDSLANGTMIPYILRAYERDWGVVLFDPHGSHPQYEYENYTHCTDAFSKYMKPYFESRNKRKKCNVEHILMVAHSAGGYPAIRMMNSKAIGYILSKYVRGIAGTDAMFPKLNAKLLWMYQYQMVVNWKAYGTVAASKAIRTKQECDNETNQMKRINEVMLSSGSNDHVYTSPSACDVIFEWFSLMLSHIAENGLFYSCAQEAIPQANNDDNGCCIIF
eukprot:469850_1